MPPTHSSIRQQWVIRAKGEDPPRYADFLYEDRDQPVRWTWVTEIVQARWMTFEMLPELFRALKQQRESVYAVPMVGTNVWNGPSHVKLHVERIEVHPGWEPER